MKYKGVYQRNSKDCAVACLLSIIKYYNGSNTFNNIRYLTKCSNNGVTALNLIEASKKLGFESKGLRCSYEDLFKLPKPLICHIKYDNGYTHFVVLHKVSNSGILVFDPYNGLKKYSKEDFLRIWTNIVITLKPIRKLDYIKENNMSYLKEIIINNLFYYIMIIIISLVVIFVSLFSSSYFKLLLESNNKNYILKLFLIIIAFKEIIVLLRNKILLKLESNVLTSLNVNTHKTLLSLPYYYFSSRTCGDIITKFNDLEYVKQILVDVPICMFVDVSLLIFSSIILININLKLFVIFLISCLLYVIILLLNDRKQKNIIEQVQDSNSIKTSYLYENINAIDSIKNMNISNLRHDRFKIVYNNYIKSLFKYERLCSNISFIKNIIFAFSTNIILYYGIKLVDNNVISLSNLILFNSLIVFFLNPLNEIYELFPLIKKGINSIKRVGEIFDIKINDSSVLVKDYDIKINDLSHSFDGYNDVLLGVNYNINEKDKIMVLGESGSGKSTLFKLVSKIYESRVNSIYIGGNDINQVDVSNLITYVSENEKLFNDTLNNNIVLNNENSNLNRILEITKVKEILERKNISLNSIIEEDGTNLSKGEKQKIILSRSLLKSSKILILDESLSGLEIEEEYEIMKNILLEFKYKTIIYISHSKVCIPLFNKIINFDKKEDLWSYQKLN